MLESITGIAAVAFVFGLIVAIHEWGHMVAAKLCGVAVPDFAIGMGPSLASKVWRGTRYHICALPIGGFVRIEGLEPEGSIEEKSSQTADGLHVAEGRSWSDTNAWQKAFMLLAGPLMNILLGLVFMLLMGFVGFPAAEVRIVGIMPGSPAESAGLLPGDVVTAVDGVSVSFPSEVSSIIQDSELDGISMELIRGGSNLTLLAHPIEMEELEGRKGLGFTMESAQFTNVINLVETKKIGFQLEPESASENAAVGLKAGDKLVAINGREVSDGLELYFLLPENTEDGQYLVAGEELSESELEPIGITIDRDGDRIGYTIPATTGLLDLGVGFQPLLVKLSPLESVKRSGQDALGLMVGLYYGFKMIIEQGDASSLGGPVTIANIIAQSTKTGAYTFFLIIILINVNLAVFNLLPVPALDGGRLVFVVLNGIGLRIPQRIEAAFHTVGMMVLLGLILLISVFDVKGVLNL